MKAARRDPDCQLGRGAVGSRKYFRCSATDSHQSYTQAKSIIRHKTMETPHKFKRSARRNSYCGALYAVVSPGYPGINRLTGGADHEHA
jgi:hypothetical protein